MRGSFYNYLDERLDIAERFSLVLDERRSWKQYLGINQIVFNVESIDVDRIYEDLASFIVNLDVYQIWQEILVEFFFNWFFIFLAQISKTICIDILIDFLQLEIQFLEVLTESEVVKWAILILSYDSSGSLEAVVFWNLEIKIGSHIVDCYLTILFLIILTITHRRFLNNFLNFQYFSKYLFGFVYPILYEQVVN